MRLALRSTPGLRPARAAAGVTRSCRFVRVRAVEEKGTPQVMLSGEETDDGENITAEYCSLDGSGKRVKAKRT